MKPPDASLACRIGWAPLRMRQGCVEKCMPGKCCNGGRRAASAVRAAMPQWNTMPYTHR